MNGAFHRLLFAIALAKSQSIFLQRGMPMWQHIKRELALPQLWRSPAEDLFRHSAAFHPLLYAGGRNEHFAEKQPDAPSRWHSRASVTSHRVVPGCRGSVFAALRRDKAGGGTRQRKREAGGTPGGVSSCKKTQVKVISPYWEQSINYIWHFLLSNL